MPRLGSVMKLRLIKDDETDGVERRGPGDAQVEKHLEREHRKVIATEHELRHMVLVVTAASENAQP